jgi:hypothetical protein
MRMKVLTETASVFCGVSGQQRATKSNKLWIEWSERKKRSQAAPRVRPFRFAHARSLRKRLQHCRRRLQLGETVGAAIERKLIAAPLLHIPVLVDMRRLPGLLSRKPRAQ